MSASAEVRERQLAIVLVDLARFTHAVAGIELRALASLVATFYRAGEEVISSHGGRVVKFIGDGCLAVFEPDDAVRAVDAVEQLRSQVLSIGADHGVELDLGANVHLSTVAEGDFGLQRHLRRDRDGRGPHLPDGERSGDADQRTRLPQAPERPASAVAEAPATGDLHEGGLMGALPSGIVAFLMTDVVASSRAWNAAPAEMEVALRSLDADVHAIAATHGGAVVKGGVRATATSLRSRRRRRRSEPRRTCNAVGTRLSVRACVLVGEAGPGTATTSGRWSTTAPASGRSHMVARSWSRARRPRWPRVTSRTT